MRSLLALGACLSAVALGVGCSHTTYRKNPGDHDHGFRFYRPKPFLFLKPNPEKDDPTEVLMELTWLPDFNEQYSVHVSPGVGTNKTEITLENGWNLTKNKVILDSKIDEFLGAIQTLLGTDPKLLKELPAGGGGGQKYMKAAPTVTVCVHDVPLGLYEAVLNPGPDGKRRLYGWRYVGFAPFGSCPLAPQGGEAVNCAEADLYGLVCYDGKMYFRKLSEVAAQPRPAPVQTVLNP